MPLSYDIAASLIITEAGNYLGDSSELSVTAPQVTEITVESSYNSQTFTFFSDHDGDNENDHQLATVPVGAVNTISMTFSRAIDTLGMTASSLIIVDDPDNPTTTKTPTSLTWDGLTATWTFSSMLGSGEWYFKLESADFATTTGIQLDGDWDNPAYYNPNDDEVTDFHSGDGSPGGDFVFAFTILPGDANRDCVVDGSDATILANYWQATNATWEMGDFNGSEVVDGSDATILANYWQIAYWQPPAMMGMSSSSFSSLSSSSSSNSLATIDTIFEKYGFTTETEEDDAVYGTEEWDNFIDELLGVFA